MSKNYDEIEKAFSAWSSRKVIADVVPPEWFTAAQFAERSERSERHASRMLEQMEKELLVESRMFKVARRNRVYHVVHYRNR